MLTNNIISFEQLGPAVWFCFQSSVFIHFMAVDMRNICFLFLHKTYFVKVVCPQYMFSWRNKKNVKSFWLKDTFLEVCILDKDR